MKNVPPTSVAGPSFFASRSVGAHLARGAIGMAAIAGAVLIGRAEAGGSSTLGSLALGIVALAAFRGCPVCWTIGLLETIGGDRLSAGQDVGCGERRSP